jgi:hypothetical protein
LKVVTAMMIFSPFLVMHFVLGQLDTFCMKFITRVYLAIVFFLLICLLTLGILGFEKFGSQVARRANGLGIYVIAHDPYASADRARHGSNMF